MIVKRPSLWPSNASCAAICRLGLEGIQGAAKCLRHQVARRVERFIGAARALSLRRPRPKRHDENISFEEAARIIGADIATRPRCQPEDLQLRRDYARKRGIIIADTKFEFGELDGKLILIDEVLTPDSSRFWPADQYQPGKASPVSTNNSSRLS